MITITLYCVASGASAPTEIKQDWLHADDEAKKAHEPFVEDRLVDKKNKLSQAYQETGAKNIWKFGETH